MIPNHVHEWSWAPYWEDGPDRRLFICTVKNCDAEMSMVEAEEHINTKERLRLWLHIWNMPTDNWDTWNMGLVAATDDINMIPGLGVEPLVIPDDAEHTVVELVPGLRIYGEGYDRASLEVDNDPEP